MVGCGEGGAESEGQAQCVVHAVVRGRVSGGRERWPVEAVTSESGQRTLISYHHCIAGSNGSSFPNPTNCCSRSLRTQPTCSPRLTGYGYGIMNALSCCLPPSHLHLPLSHLTLPMLCSPLVRGLRAAPVTPLRAMSTSAKSGLLSKQSKPRPLPATFSRADLDYIRERLLPPPPEFDGLPPHTKGSPERPPRESAVILPLCNVVGQATLIMQVRAAALRVHASEAG